METATFAGGCFWCTEAIFKRLNGILSVISGYSGGNTENPSYEQVSSGMTGHAESVQILFDPKLIPYETLLDIFFATHNPTTPNRQGADIGSQYRSIIFYHSDGQKRSALRKIQELEQSHMYNAPIVTTILPFSAFYEAENYHQNYYDVHQEKPYCQIVITPKIKKLLEKYSENIKSAYKT